MDVDQLGDLSMEYDIHAMPAFKFLIDGKIVDDLKGASTSDLNKKCKALSTK